MKIIPAIDLLAGKCVRLKQGSFKECTNYPEDPLSIAQAYENIGFKYLHLVDLEGAKEGVPLALKTLEQLARQTKLKIDYSGGLRSLENISSAFDAGAYQINIGSLALKDEELLNSIIQHFGAEKVIVALDCAQGKLLSHGWLEAHQISLDEFMQHLVRAGVKAVASTVIERDGMLEGPDFEFYRKLLSNYANLDFIASGGISSISDLIKLKTMGLKGAIIGKALLENKITTQECRNFLDQHN